MIKQKAKVVAVAGDKVWLQAERQSTCSQCQVKQGCGTGLMAKHVGKRFSHIAVTTAQDVKVGQQVALAIPEQTLLQGAMLMYLLPLLSLMAFSLLARVFNFSALSEIIFGFTGLCIGFYLVRICLRNKKDGFQAKLVEEKT